MFVKKTKQKGADMFNEKLDDVVARIEQSYDHSVIDFNNTNRHFPNKLSS